MNRLLRNVLIAATLALGFSIASAETPVSGEVSGTWTKAGSPYRVTFDVTVPEGQTLTIEAGVEVHVSDGFAFTVQGRVLASGTANERIVFRPSPSALYEWHGIRIWADSSAFSHVEIAGAYGAFGGVAILGSRTRATFSDCAISGNGTRNSGGGVLVDSARATFTGCRINDNVADGIHDNPTGMPIGNGEGGGVCVQRGAIVIMERCKIAANTANYLGAGILVKDAGTLVSLTNCVIDTNRAVYGGPQPGHGGGVSVSGSASVVIDRCVITRNLSLMNPIGGVLVLSGNPAVTIRNSIIWGNVGNDVGGGIDVAWSDYRPKGGTISGTGNISADPLFVGPAHGDYRLSPGSPCIDAGDPAAPLDPDGSRADIGLYPSLVGPLAIGQAAPPIAFALYPNAPNPFNPETTIRYALTEPGEIRLAVYGIDGRLVRVLVANVGAAGVHEVAWDGTDAAGRPVASGIYLYRLVAPEGTRVRKMALLR